MPSSQVEDIISYLLGSISRHKGIIHFIILLLLILKSAIVNLTVLHVNDVTV